jgi:riboflavin synthase
MFTGIVQGTGEILAAQSAGVGTQGLRLTVAFGSLDAADVAIGDSIALNGACMTVVALQGGRFEVDISQESLVRTCGLNQPGPVNLEKAMRASDRLGGHMVSGHIDGTGVVVGLSQVGPDGSSWRLDLQLPESMAAFVTEKGSIAVNGVSLTINELTDSKDHVLISVNLIPHTWQATTLHQLAVGDQVNIEVDQLAKQVARIVDRIYKK